ncbi:MAG: hypothetical protein LRZ84_14300 [Desertifilum sp.]|nr:hypothetical protein [Desertifilum sp.]
MTVAKFRDRLKFEAKHRNTADLPREEYLSRVLLVYNSFDDRFLKSSPPDREQLCVNLGAIAILTLVKFAPLRNMTVHQAIDWIVDGTHDSQPSYRESLNTHLEDIGLIIRGLEYNSGVMGDAFIRQELRSILECLTFKIYPQRNSNEFRKVPFWKKFIG